MSEISNLLSILLHLLLLAAAAAAAVQSSPLLGISPQDHKYYFDGAVIACRDGSKTFPRNRLNDDFCDCPDGTDEPDHKYYFDGAVIACRDGSKTFPRNRLNDDFCDCPDGTDEPGTAACPESKFYCRNAGDVPLFLFSSRVNDRICDCCDGSDEYDGGVICPNTCLGNGDNLNTKVDELDPTIITSNQVNAEQRTSRLDVKTSSRI